MSIEKPEWLLARLQRLRQVSKEATQRREDAITSLATLERETKSTEQHLAACADVHHREDPEKRIAMEARNKELGGTFESLTKQLELQREYVARAREFDDRVGLLYAECERWLDWYPDPDAVFEKVEIPVYHQGDPLVRLAQVRNEIAALADELERVREAPLARNDLQMIAQRFIDDLYALGEPEVVVDDKGRFEVNLGGVGVMKRPNSKTLLALLTWLEPEIVTQKLMGLVDVIPTHKDALTLDVKEQRRREIEAKRSAALYEEGALVRQCLESQLLTPISKDQRAEHVLGVRASRASDNVRPIITGKGKATLPSLTESAAGASA